MLSNYGVHLKLILLYISYILTQIFKKATGHKFLELGEKGRNKKKTNCQQSNKMRQICIQIVIDGEVWVKKKQNMR